MTCYYIYIAVSVTENAFNLMFESVYIRLFVPFYWWTCIKYVWNETDERKERAHLFSLFGGCVSISPSTNKHMQTFQVSSAAEEERIIFRETSLPLNRPPCCCWLNRGQRGCLRGALCLMDGV